MLFFFCCIDTPSRLKASIHGCGPKRHRPGSDSAFPRPRCESHHLACTINHLFRPKHFLANKKDADPCPGFVVFLFSHRTAASASTAALLSEKQKGCSEARSPLGIPSVLRESRILNCFPSFCLKVSRLGCRTKTLASSAAALRLSPGNNRCCAY